MGARLLRLPIARDQAPPVDVAPWRTIAEGYAPPPTADLAGHLERVVEQLDALLAIAAAFGAPADRTGTPSIVAAQPLVDQAELAEILHSNPRTVRQMEAKGRLPPAEKVGRKRLYDRMEVLRWIAAGRPERKQWVSRGRR